MVRSELIWRGLSRWRERDGCVAVQHVAWDGQATGKVRRSGLTRTGDGEAGYVATVGRGLGGVGRVSKDVYPYCESD